MGSKIVAFVQAFLLVSAIFASAYIVKDIFGKVGIVSAELSEQEIENILSSGSFTEEEKVYLREQLPGLGDEEAQELLDFYNAGKVETPQEPNWLLNWFGNLFPAISEISGVGAGANILSFTGGIKVCPETKDGKICQEMTGNDCDANCNKNCIDGSLKDLPDDSECKLGTCFDSEEGTCQPRSPQEECENNGGNWNEDPYGNIPQCTKGCCTIVDQALFVTEKQCEKKATSRGVDDWNFDITITDELSCLYGAQPVQDGACVIGNGIEKSCTITKNEICDSSGGQFFANYLCSNEELGTVCEKQARTDCVEGLDEIYWFDSCGNKENIYEGSKPNEKEKSWNNGEIKKKEDSCEIGTPTNPVKNQDSCGNCNRLLDSYCGEKTADQKLDDSDQDVVCLDMSCSASEESGGIDRKHGQSWCAYQSQIGLPGADMGALDLLRGLIPDNPITGGLFGEYSADTPGSRHFRKSCLNGEVVVTPCANYRNEICVENRNEEGEEFSQASCRINRWQECLAYNPGMLEGQAIGMTGKQAGTILDIKLKATCGLDPDCFVKEVDLTSGSDDTFKFSYCAPRYPPGFDLKENPEAAGQICSQASNTCTKVQVKTLNGWECKVNCDCDTDDFAKQMNELCISLGDCGSSVNYVGNPGIGGYSVSEGENSYGNILNQFGTGLGGGGIGGLLGGSISTNFLDANPTEGEYIQAAGNELLDGAAGNWIQSIFDGFGGGEMFGGGGSGEEDGTGLPESGGEKAAGGAVTAGLVTGGLGAAALATTVAASSSLSAGSGAAFGSIVVAEGASGSALTAASFSNALLGAGVGMAITGFMIDALGIGPGLDAFTTYTLVGVGGVSGGFIGAGLMGAAGTEGGFWATTLGPIGVVMAVAVIATIIIFKIMGIGEVEEIKINFECKPWTPPIGGDCESCGVDKLSDGSNSFPCNKYACEALGQNCEYIAESEGPEGGICANAASSDTSSPQLVTPLEESLSIGFEYEDVSGEGFSIVKENVECMDQFESVTFGFSLNEPGQCVISGDPEFATAIPISGWEKKKVITLSSADLESLGLQNDPVNRNDVVLFVACEDILGNANENSAFSIDFCIVPEDFTAPFISYPLSQVILPFDAKEKAITFFVNEPSECKWDFNDVNFDGMTNNANCYIGKKGSQGYQCSFTVPIENSETDVYVKCKDHPEWIGTSEEGDRNENEEGIKITIVKSENNLMIDYIKPDGEVINSGTPIVSVDIEAGTSGGADGTANCLYSIDGGAEDAFQVSGGSVHKQTISQFVAGDHTIDVSCIDAAGNKAEGISSFTIELDTKSANIARVYDQGGTLYVITNEDSSCAYSFTTCNFLVNDGIEMGGSGGISHSTNFDPDKTYHIKCKDKFGNEKSQCDLVVSGGLF
jgi:hypothetical protein